MSRPLARPWPRALAGASVIHSESPTPGTTGCGLPGDRYHAVRLVDAGDRLPTCRRCQRSIERSVGARLSWQVGTRPPGEDEPPPADPALAELDRIGKVLMAAGYRHDADGHASQPPAYDEMAGIVGTLARTATTQEDVRRAARALLYLYDTEPEASDGPEADAAWAALREALGDEEPTP